MRYEPLTAEQKETLRLRREGMSNKEIARALGVTRSAVCQRNTAIHKKLGVKDTHNAVLVDWVMQEYLGER